MDNTANIQDAFIFCPMLGSFVLKETLEQGIFASERKMSQIKETKISIFKKLISIEFDKKGAIRSKKQAITEYLMDVKDNAKNIIQHYS